MENLKTEQQKYSEAEEQVKEIKGFYTHLIIYICVISFLIFINLTYTPEYLWFIWSASGWGIGLIAHSNKAFNWIPVFGKNWEERKIKELMNNTKNK